MLELIELGKYYFFSRPRRFGKSLLVSTATPAFLIELIKKQQFDLSDVDGGEMDSASLMALESEYMSPLPVLLQTGYLTITGFDKAVVLLGVEFDQNTRIIGGYVSHGRQSLVLQRLYRI